MVIPFVVLHPAPVVYIIRALPAEAPVIIPDDEPTDANAGAEELQLPPAVPSVNVVVAPVHKAAAPVIAAGSA